MRSQYPLQEFDYYPALRADFAVIETYAYTPESPLDCPIISSPVAPDLYNGGVVNRSRDGRIMGKRLVIEPHLSVEELESHYRSASDPIERTRYQIIWLLAKGFVTEEVVSVTGYYRDRIRKIARRYNQLGPQGLIDRRRVHKGRAPMLSDIEQAHLWQALDSLADDGGLWNGRKVADWMAQLKGKPIHRQRGWEYLRVMNFRPLVPRAEHEEADIEQQQEWKKN